MRQISVLKDFQFAEDGHHFREFKAGEVAVDVTDACADSAAQMGVAEDYHVCPGLAAQEANRGRGRKNR